MSIQLSQIIHDIKSPLTVLRGLANNNLPETNLSDEDLLLRNVIKRVEEMLSELVEEADSTKTKKRSVKYQQAILPICEEIVSEKKEFYKLNPLIKISLTNQDENPQVHANPAILKRILSNLINNAVEAKKGFGIKVNLTLSCEDNKTLITISDNGLGIPENIISKLAQKGFSHNKPSGSGLGLYHARKNIESWGGFLTLNSIVNEGTTVKIVLTSKHKL